MPDISEFGGSQIGQNFDLPSDNEELFAVKIIENLFSKKDLNFKTDLTDREIKLLTRLTVISKILNMKSLEKVVDEFKELRISLNRKGRQELVEALAQAQREKRNRFEAVKDLFGV